MWRPNCFASLWKETVGEVKGIKVGIETYLGGLTDLVGEILRFAVKQATERHHKELFMPARPRKILCRFWSVLILPATCALKMISQIIQTEIGRNAFDEV